MKTPPPPRWLDRLLNWLVAPHLREEVLGDLHERYARRVRRLGERQARSGYWREVLAYLRPRFIKRQPNEYPQPNPIAMLTTYLKIAWRNIRFSKTFSLINGFGLTLGISCSLLVFLVIMHETSYDRQHKNADRIFRVETMNKNYATPHAGTYTELSSVLKEAPEFEAVVPIWNEWGRGLSIPASGDSFKERIAFVDPAIFQLLDYRWVAGDAPSALSQPNRVVLTESYAKKFFGTTDAIGKTIRYDNSQDLQVAGVLEDYPVTTNFPFDVLVSFPTLKRVNPGYDSHGWTGFGDNHQIYVLLKSAFQPQQLAKRFHDIQVKYQKDPKTVENQQFVLNPLSEVHYAYNLSGRQANPKLLRMLGLIGVFVLLIACINFINLTTAQTLKRAKEIGVRKAVGSSRGSLMIQFMAEAGLVTFLASLTSVVIAWLLLPFIASLMGLPLHTTDLFTWKTGAFLVAILGLTTLLTGAYPAFRLSGMPPIWALKSNKLPQGERRISLRQGLVVVQFTISMILMSCALFTNRQVSFFQQADLGFNKNAIITVSLPENQPEKLRSLRVQLMESPQIKEVSYSFNSASAESNWMQGIQYRENAEIKEVRTQIKMGDAHFLDTYCIQLLAGEKLQDADTLSALPKVLVNEIFLQRVGISNPEAALGQKVYFGDGSQLAIIKGVVKNFHVNSLHQKIDPTLIQVVPNHFYQAGIKLQSEKPTPQAIQTALTTLVKAWKTTFPHEVFEYKFLDDTLAQAYHNEARTVQLIEASTLVAILIACLGLFGLATFTAEQRTKEIGVRKVLGASVASLVSLITKDFLKLVLLAGFIAAPIAWYAMRQWLQNFEFKTEINGWVFALTVLLMGSIALATVSFQAIRAALMNPVKSLRSE
ncbi:ABC transporter permease [Rhabdobacter roseus]|uniref:Putative ABC transport system permease protein n=1 Tax=Rhabdobacter roseus TaxID=1655419 RepID=A0A840TGZ4_9BACT|nr:ABC transporter permease [Rhabdobacter roseus]MBB5283416.1 putative ABC transport system permease protein [Rhabdobacter roseus]